MFTKARHSTPSWAIAIQPTFCLRFLSNVHYSSPLYPILSDCNPAHTYCLRFPLSSTSLRLVMPDDFFPFGFPIRMCHDHQMCTHATCLLVPAPASSIARGSLSLQWRPKTRETISQITISRLGIFCVVPAWNTIVQQWTRTDKDRGEIKCGEIGVKGRKRSQRTASKRFIPYVAEKNTVKQQRFWEIDTSSRGLGIFRQK
jgi:hypothetical protein